MYTRNGWRFSNQFLFMRYSEKYKTWYAKLPDKEISYSENAYSGYAKELAIKTRKENTKHYNKFKLVKIKRKSKI